ncbi:hypothetical protein DL770_009641 [Monosporascus sp. CRB-9-2]|nr:hypothetical protein DL770_009641 [Monosporascus sp. CRB-9-2]
MSTSQFDHVKRFAEVLDINIQLAAQDLFGVTGGGTITLRAPLAELESKDILNILEPSSPYPKAVGGDLPQT